MDKSSNIYVAGHRGLVGSAIRRILLQRGFSNLILKTHDELDLTDVASVNAFFLKERPAFVFLAAAKVGGILANSRYPADFIRVNLQIQTNVIEASRTTGVERLLFLGSSCIYPKLCPQPIREQYLLSGDLEPTNRAYALAKIAGIEMCWAYNQQYGTRYLCAMPSNLYGPDDNYNLNDSHVLPALIRKVAEAKAAAQQKIEVWGTGTPRREFLFSDDLAEACVFLMQLDTFAYDSLFTEEYPPLVNIGSGEDVTIRELAETVSRVLEYDGELAFDASKPDGTPRKLLDSSRMRSLGWMPRVDLEEGIMRSYLAAKHQILSPVIASQAQRGERRLSVER